MYQASLKHMELHYQDSDSWLSEELPDASLSKNVLHNILIFSFDQKLPLFYRVLPGDVRDVRSLKADRSYMRDVLLYLSKHRRVKVSTTG
jgi:hypothetical protein